MVLDLSSVNYLIILVVLVISQVSENDACNKGNLRPNIPNVNKRVWKAYTNRTLEMEVFDAKEKDAAYPVNVTLEINSEMNLSPNLPVSYTHLRAHET